MNACLAICKSNLTDVVHQKKRIGCVDALFPPEISLRENENRK